MELISGKLAANLDVSQIHRRRSLGIQQETKLKKNPVNFRFEEDVYDYLQKEAQTLNLDVANLIRFALREWVRIKLDLATEPSSSKAPSVSNSDLMTKLEEMQSMLSSLSNFNQPIKAEHEPINEEVITSNSIVDSLATEFNFTMEPPIESEDDYHEDIQSENTPIENTPIENTLTTLHEPVVGSKFTGARGDYQIWDIREVDGEKKYFIDKNEPELSATLNQLEKFATFTYHPSKPRPIIKMKPLGAESSKKEQVTLKQFEDLVAWHEEYKLEINPDNYEILD